MVKRCRFMVRVVKVRVPFARLAKRFASPSGTLTARRAALAAAVTTLGFAIDTGGLLRMLEARDRAVAPTGSLSIDSRRSRLAFEVRYFGVLRVQGEFTDMRGEIVGMDPRSGSAASVSAVVPIRSLATGISLRDRHLCSRGYLGARRCPEATFRSDRIVSDGNAGARVMGTLTLRGVTREVMLDVKECRFDDEERRMHAEAHLTVRRSDFAIGPSWRASWWDPRRYLIDDEVRMVLHVEAVEREE